MAKRRVVQRKPTAPVAPEPEEELEVIEEEEAEEEPKPAPKPRRRRTARAKPKPEPEPEPEEEDDVEEEQEADDAESIPEVTATGNELADAILALADAGKAVTLTKSGDKYVLTPGTAPTITAQPATTASGRPVRAMTVGQMEAIALNPEWIEWNKWWKDLTFEEKVAEAKEAEAEWEEIDDALAHNLRVSLAYREAMEIDKWRPEYALKKARDALLYQGIEAEAED